MSHTAVSPTHPSPPRVPTVPRTGRGTAARAAVSPTSPLSPRLLPATPDGAGTSPRVAARRSPRRRPFPSPRPLRQTSASPVNGGKHQPLAIRPCVADGAVRRWGDKGCCLPHGGSPNPPKPPKDTDCPPNWEWNPSKKHCVPKHPNQPPPQCPPGWGWNGGSTCCTPHTPTPPAPTPSSKPGKGGYHGHKRAHKARNVSLCPNSMEACPIAGLTGLTDDWECLDTRTELQSCGGCASTGAGEDCTAIPGAWNVGCNEGKCVGA